jgi:hypothetical protein
MHRIVAVSILCLTPLLLSACGRVPKATKTRESGQSGLMDESFAAQNKCNPKNHLRPFIIEWDGTDMSSFEAYAASDIVVVRYEGCDMQVLDECRNDSIRGSQGAYKAVDWTTGQLEKMQIANEGELYAKLPLGSASLGGRVAGGEKFMMEYYVAGTRTATRAAVYREDIAANPGCEGATHFVYNYNLGAFALGTTKKFEAEAGVSAFGFGTGGKTSSNSQVDKKGGDLGVCKSDSATEVAGCKAPIRLTLRAIRDGANPEKEAMQAPDTEESLNAAGVVNAKIENNEKANAHMQSAMSKFNAKDGKGCLSELDSFDKAAPKMKSIDPKSPYSMTRANCLMITGKCDAGKQLLRKAYEQLTQMTPAQIDSAVSNTAQSNCQGGLTPREELIKASDTLGVIAQSGDKPTPERCTELHDKIKKLLPKTPPRDDEDYEIIRIEPGLNVTYLRCLARAGDCKKVYKMFVATTWKPEDLKNVPPDVILSSFEGSYEKCKGKPVQ